MQHQVVPGARGRCPFRAKAGELHAGAAIVATDAGGVDRITSGGGQDIIIGGRFGDTIAAGNGDNLVIGDSGRTRAASTSAPQLGGLPITLGVVETITYADGGADIVTTVTADKRNAVILTPPMIGAEIPPELKPSE